MKTRLNILCVLIFVAIAGSIVNSVSEGFNDFIWGYEAGSKEMNPQIANDAFISLNPDVVGLYTDSVYNAKTGEWLPMQYREVVVQTEQKMLSFGEQAILLIAALVLCVLAIFQLTVFCKLIYAINKLKVFVWSNVLKLRLIGGAMVLSFIVNAVCQYIYYSNYAANIDIPGYSIGSGGIWNFQELIPGLGVLLMGEIFAMGLRLREEQELTI